MSDAPVTVELPPTEVVPIEKITPYWRNPRRITDQAVEAVADSIRRYGYVQPITVDKDYVIIVGHTRHQAMLKLGISEVAVYVAGHLTEDKAREYRLVDNRTSEMTSWDHDLLVMEIREWETKLLEQFFPDVDLEIGQLQDAMTQEKIDAAATKVASVTGQNPSNVHTTEVVCPACFHTFEVRTRSLPGLTSDDIDELAQRDGAPE